MIITTEDEKRFWSYAARGRWGGCWAWIGSARKDYGIFSVQGKRMPAHHFAYSLMGYGSVPEGMELDHLCYNKWCVNPGHLEVVTHQVNSLRGSPKHHPRRTPPTHCKRNHEFTEQNTIWRGTTRECRACRQRRRSPNAYAKSLNPNPAPYAPPIRSTVPESWNDVD